MSRARRPLGFEEVPALLGDLVVGGAPAGWPSGAVASLEQDSRRLSAGGLFVAVAGGREDGRAYIPQAAERGARAVVGPEPASGGLPYLRVRDPRRASAILSARFAGDPSHRLDVVGITGTNGKTTTSWLLQSLWEGCGVPAAVLGTLGSGRPPALLEATHTTPDAPRFQARLRDLADEGIRAVAAEVSSHALDQDRAYATRFRAAVFTNLTRDHLDYHGTPEAYLDAKRRLFLPQGRGDPAPCTAVVNLDDPVGREIVRGSPDPVFGYGESAEAQVRLEDLVAGPEGLRLRVATPRGPRRISSPLIGSFNAANVLAAYATAAALGLPLDAVEEALARGVRVPGRMERVDAGQPFLVLVDYAHTPDALERALAALRSLTRGRLRVVFGCGGDRDAGKRPQMGGVAARGADAIVLTNDNPRREDPLAILEAIREGVRAAGREPDRVTPDREEAIRATIASAKDGDTVLIAGKGHEGYQETAEGRRAFDDRAAARAALEELGWTA